METNDREQMIAYPGYALVGMKPRYGDFEGQLEIPGSARSRATIARLGLVCSVNPYPEGEDSLIYEKGKLVARPAWVRNADYTSLTGQYVLVRNAVRVIGELFSVRLEFIESTASEDVEPKQSDVKRCFQCRSKGEGNIILGSDGYCPICGYNEYHEHRDEQNLREMFANDRDLEDHIIHIPAEVQHALNGGGALKGNVISFPGQKNRGGLTVGNVSDITRRWLDGK